ncbi:putative C-type lectin domain family 20 member A isoform X4 [Brienomyrus brachyistius]|nr:putative C-type lectin domain family 20 member A isoform X3 [Brienomyrus brachyistius]XP_048826073.1 putative C-type lectin domain family 20 member A isoform X3 [Brienomyrus brachyistius]XP_048826074.1 putative C-type lectin domain family 20 member A isoform X4 [Brienomyrus brachyistius]
MMGYNVFLLLKLLLISEFHSHCSCLLHQYHFVNINLTWTDAQAYCRQNYTDLATIDNMKDMKSLTGSMGSDYTGEAWIGLQNGSLWRWHWSSGEGGTGYRNWESGQQYHGGNTEHCTKIRDNGTWNDAPCSLNPDIAHFICYTAPTCNNGVNATWNFTLIKKNMSWPDAQSYCRQSYTDLATVRNKEDNDLLHKMVPNGTQAWIGLFRDTWGWSDLSNSSFRNWKNGENYYVNNACALAQVTWPGTWDVTPCDEKHPFICYDDSLILVNSNMTWNEALNYCRTHHWDLVSVHNEEIQYWVSRLAEDASTDHVWLGLRFSCYLNFWFWVSAENVCYQNWAPNNISNNNLCGTTGAVQSKDPHYWVSLPETKELNFICSKCQVDPRMQYVQELLKCLNV